MDFLTNLDSETLKAELLAFLELGDDEFDISSMGEFEEQFVEFIKDDLSYADYLGFSREREVMSMIHAICDFCGKDCDRTATLLSMTPF